MKHLEAEGRVELDAALTIMIRGRELTSREANMIEIATPITIVGDLHGQFYDMVRVSRVSQSKSNESIDLDENVREGRGRRLESLSLPR